MVVGLTADKFPVITVSPGRQLRSPSSPASTAPASSCCSRACRSWARCSRRRRPRPPPRPRRRRRRDRRPGAPAGPGTNLNGQQEIVILAVTAQQAEVLKFAQMDGNVTLALRVGRRLRRPGHRRRPASGLRRDDRRHPQGPRRLVRCPAAGGRPDRDPDRHQEAVARRGRGPAADGTPTGATGASDIARSGARPVPRSDLTQATRPNDQGPTRARWPTRSVSSSSMTSPRPAIT